MALLELQEAQAGHQEDGDLQHAEIPDHAPEALQVLAKAQRWRRGLLLHVLAHADFEDYHQRAVPPGEPGLDPVNSGQQKPEPVLGLRFIRGLKPLRQSEWRPLHGLSLKPLQEGLVRLQRLACEQKPRRRHLLGRRLRAVLQTP